jgi:DUF2934 family protein
MHAVEKIMRDAAEVGISAALLGLEIGTKLLRPNFLRKPRVEPMAPHGTAAAPHEPRGTVRSPFGLRMGDPPQEQIERRAYERWERAGKPHGCDKEFYRLAELELRHQNWPIH